jgi:hypothetical protein
MMKKIKCLACLALWFDFRPRKSNYFDAPPGIDKAILGDAIQTVKGVGAAMIFATQPTLADRPIQQVNGAQLGASATLPLSRPISLPGDYTLYAGLTLADPTKQVIILGNSTTPTTGTGACFSVGASAICSGVNGQNSVTPFFSTAGKNLTRFRFNSASGNACVIGTGQPEQQIGNGNPSTFDNIGCWDAILGGLTYSSDSGGTLDFLLLVSGRDIVADNSGDDAEVQKLFAADGYGF